MFRKQQKAAEGAAAQTVGCSRTLLENTFKCFLFALNAGDKH